MKKSLFLLIAIPLLAVSCNDDDNTAQANNLQGRWNLVNVSGGLMGQDLDIPSGTITWTFGYNTVKVINNNPADTSAEDFFETGNYNYEYSESEASIICTQTLKINNVDLGCVTVQDNTLKLTMQENDGYILILKR